METRNRKRKPKGEGKNPASRPHGGAEKPPRSPTTDFLIVGVGASAGGLEALQKFCNVLPADSGIAFILVQHMDPRGSMLREILGKTAGIPVEEATDRMAVRPDRIHVIPPNANMTISGGTLRIVPPPPRRASNMPIDMFLLSLAQEAKGRAVAAILSGTGTDGSRGVRAIKAEGGIVFAQDDRSAKYHGMPASAVQTGCVDFILPPDRIAREIVRIGGHPYVQIAVPDEAEAEPQVEPSRETEQLFTLLRKSTGVDFSLYKPATLQRRIHRRLVLRRVETLSDYLKILAGDAREREALSQDFLISVTSFFRDPEAFEMLKERVLPGLMKNRSEAQPVRVWVPGCSTGEEVYTLAICLLETAAALGLSVPIQMFGTDVSESAVEKARAGVYPEGISDDLTTERLQRFFVKTGHSYRISKQIREMCVFARHDLLKDPPFSRMDLVSCRNVLIYLLSSAQKMIVPMFHYAVRPEGYLCLGMSESISVFPELFELIDSKHKVYLRKNMLARPYLDLVRPRYEWDPGERDKQAMEQIWNLESVQKEADRIVLSKFGPPGVLVNEEMEILQFRGDTDPYLAPAPGPASFNLLKMSRGGIASSLRKLLLQAKAEGKSLLREGVIAVTDGGRRKFSIEVIPVCPPRGGPLHFMILFREGEESPPEKAAAGMRKEAEPETSPEGERIRELERELAETKEYLQSIVDENRNTTEELRSAIEELQSSNEELQSTNEEMETAKEELQSANEELTTVNEELSIRNSELARANNDLNNFVASADIPIVMVGKELHIRRFTPNAERALNLIPTDAGRPIGDVNLNMVISDLDRKIREVLESLTVASVDVQDRVGRWYNLKIRPYRTVDDKIDGAVLSFTDIDPIKRSLVESEATSAFLQEVIDGVREPLVLLDRKFRLISGNRSFFEFFRVPRKESVGRILFDLGSGDWDIPALRALLRETVSGKRKIRETAMEHTFPSIGRMKLSVSAQRVGGDGSDPEHLLVSLGEMSDRAR